MRPDDMMSFVQLSPFLANWRALRLGDEALRELEAVLLANPKSGAVIPGSGGVRKVRFSPSHWHTGKSGALRVCYVCFEELLIIILITAYGKNRKENVTAEEKAAMRKLVPSLRSEFAKRRSV